MDPVGFGFEQFDLVGRYRTREADQLIDASGALVATDIDGPFSGPAELSERLSKSADFRRCFVKQLWRFAEARAAASTDDPEIDALARQFEGADHHIDELVVAIVRKPTFVLRSATP